MSFSLTGTTTNGEASVGTDVATACSTDWLSIPCATNTLRSDQQSATPTICVDRICGMVFNSVTAAATTPGTDVAVPVNSKYYSRNSLNHNLTMPK